MHSVKVSCIRSTTSLIYYTRTKQTRDDRSVLGRIAVLRTVRTYVLPIRPITDRVALFCRSIGLLVCHSSESYKNGSTYRDSVWVEDSGGLKEPCIRYEVQTTAETSPSRKGYIYQKFTIFFLQFLPVCL